MPLPPLPKKTESKSSSLPKSAGGSTLPALPKASKDGDKKKVRGVLGPVDRAMDKAAGGLFNVAMSAISAPQQAVFKLGQGIGDAVTGHPGAGLKTALGGLGEIATLGQAGGDIEFAEAVGNLDDQGVRHPAKLPTGVNTLVNVVGDPLNFVTFGAGAAAKSALKTAARELPEEAVKRLTSQGLRKGLTDTEKATLREGLVDSAKLSRNPEKTADKMLKQLQVRGRGGVTVRIPGTRIAATPLSGEKIAGSKAGALGRTARDAAKDSKPGKLVRAALVPGARPAGVVGSRASDELLDALDAGRTAETNQVNDLVTRWNAAVRDFEIETGTPFGPDIDRVVHRALEGDIEEAIAAHPGLERLIRTADAIRAGSARNFEAAGVLDDVVTDGYAHRVPTDEMSEALRPGEETGRLYEGRGLSKSMTPGSAKRRSVAPDSTVPELNEAKRLIDAGEDIPDDLLRDFGRVEEYQAPIREKIAALEAQKDEILQRNLEPQAGELTVAQQRKMAADAERVRRLDKQISREAARLEQVGAAAERALGDVAAAGESRLGRIIGEGREQMERAGQLDTGLAARRRQADLAARRAEKKAAAAKRPVTVAVRTDAALDARGAADELKGVQRARTPKEVARDLNRRAGTAQAVTRGQADTAEQLTAAEVRRQETALQRAVRERDAAAKAGADRAERYKNQAAARAVRNDEKALAKIQEKVESLTDELAAKAKLAEDDTRELVEAIAQKLPPGAKMYKESAVASLIETGVEAARAVETANTMRRIRGIKAENGVPILHSADDLASLGIKPTKEGLKEVGLVEFELPKLGKFYAHPAVKGEITKFTAVIEGDDIVDKSRKAINLWDRWWRGQVTASLPGGVPFGTRNARTNVMLTVADGMPPTYFAEGGAFQWRVRQIVKNNAAEIADNGVEATMKAHLEPRDFEIWKAAREMGVVGDGFYSIDISDAPEIKAAGMPKTGGRARRAVRFVAGSRGTLATKGREFNQAVENHARMSHFLYSIDRLGDLGEAAARTNTVLFDYGRITPFEQKILKKILPFWTFMRKNLPGQMRAFVENPVRITTPEKLSDLLSEPLDDDAPEYQQRAGARVQKFGPLAGLVTTPERPLQAAVSSLEPLAQLTGVVLPGNPLGLEPERGAPQAFRSLASMAGGAPVAAGKAIADEASEGSMFTGGRLKPEEMPQRLLKAAYPQLGRAPTILSGRLPGAVQESKTKKKAQQKTLAQIAQALGFKIEELD